MSRYELVSTWHVDAPIDSVWNVLEDVARWPVWWSYVLEVQTLERGGPGGLARYLAAQAVEPSVAKRIS